VLEQLLPIAILLAVIAVVVKRLPRVDLGHSDAFRMRRALNWLPLGLTYAMLYFGRYNLAAAKDVGVLSEAQYGDIFAWGSAVYGLSFFLNGPLTDRLGGRMAILVAALGAGLANLGLGLAAARGHGGDDPSYTVLYCANMYFQSFGAVAIVKVNAAWFHVRERGTFGGIFGILIALGIYFAFDWGHRIAVHWPDQIQYLYFIPAAALLTFFVIDLVIVRDRPSTAGHADFDTADATSGDDGAPLTSLQIFGRLLRNPVIMTIAVIEFCTGFLRNATMHWYRDFAKGVGLKETFVYENWGMLLCVAGITGGVVAGVISDRLFQSRRGPVATALYAWMALATALMIPLFSIPESIGILAIAMQIGVIGAHGVLTGTAAADFGGKRYAGTTVGLIDGFVYFGTTVQSVLLGHVLPAKKSVEASDIDSWRVWPIVMIPIAVVGFALATRLWNARPQPKGAPAAH
jgi:MFS transporter, OPA family, glycerol-3-phosphate transporter